MSQVFDRPDGYGRVTRTLHWGMAGLFAAQFLAAAAHWALPRENEFRQLVWNYHPGLGALLFLLVLFRGAWGLANIARRPPRHQGLIGAAATSGHVAIYALMIIVPAVRILAAVGGKRGFSFFGLQIAPPRETAIAWTQGPAEWHGELGWLLAALVLGHIAMAMIWHHSVRRDGTLSRMLRAKGRGVV